MSDKLAAYRSKRDFQRTLEPAGADETPSAERACPQRRGLREVLTRIDLMVTAYGG